MSLLCYPIDLWLDPFETDAPASCPLYLGCKPATMDFRFNFEKLLGENDVLVNDEKTCEIESSDGLVGGEG